MDSNDINKKLAEILSGANPAALQNGKQSVEQLLKSPQGQKLVNQLSAGDKQKLLNTFMNLNNDEIKNKLKNVKIPDLSGMSVDEILKKLR